MSADNLTPECIAALKKAQTQPYERKYRSTAGHVGIWISLKDSHPPEREMVLTYPGWATTDGIALDEWLDRYDCFLMSVDDGHEITHWMRLPPVPTT